MTEKQIKKLIDKFFDGDTTLAEERKLYAYFSRGEVAAPMEEYRQMFADLATLPLPRRKSRLCGMRLWVSGIAASLLLAAGAYAGRQMYDYHQLDMRYGGSYMIVHGKRIDNLREIQPYLERTLSSARDIEQTAATQPTADDMEADLLSHITDPGQRAEIEELLN